MIELTHDRLVFRFPEVHPDAVLAVSFQRTLRIPDDGREHFLPPGLGCFPLRHVEDHADRVPALWAKRGGVMLPMHRTEALWLSFHAHDGYPFAVKVAAGKVNAVTGGEWDEEKGLRRRPQNYLPVPEQPWLDGLVVEKGVIRQFVAMPLGEGHTVEEQVTGKAEHGGLQIQAFPLRAELWARILEERRRDRSLRGARFALNDLMATPMALHAAAEAPAAMGLGAGGRMRQEIYKDRRALGDWESSHASRCFVHLVPAEAWPRLTGSAAPPEPPAAADYTSKGGWWYDYQDEGLDAVEAIEPLEAIQSVGTIAKQKGESVLPEDEKVGPQVVVPLGPKAAPSADVVSEGEF